MAGGRDLVNEVPTLMGNPHNIRNLCIMAHVDHGKTSLADSLVASNGIISQRLAGRIRYMGSRKDEVERGITMKSSCVSLTYAQNDQKYLINLIDSPGHVDFSSEVSTAVRLCDGTIIVVDVVEGVCAQTKVVLQQAWVEDIRPVLVLNKIDRLILETKLSPIDCYYHIAQVLESVNAYMAELYNTAVEDKRLREMERRKREGIERRLSERDRRFSGSETVQDEMIDGDLEDEEDDTNLYFSPERGNVVFASAYDGWGFSIGHFASEFSRKLGMNQAVLSKTLWGDYYISSKGGKKKILQGARDKHKNPLFVTMILESLYKVYDSIMVNHDKNEVERLAQCLGVKMPKAIANSYDKRQKLNFLCSSWLPLASAVLEMVVDHLPSAASMTEERTRKLMCSATQSFESLPPSTQKLKEAFLECSRNEDAPLIVYVSKMFGVQRKNLPEKGTAKQRIGLNARGGLSEEDIEARREEIRRRREAAQLANATDPSSERQLSSQEILELQKQREEMELERQKSEEERQKLSEEEVFIAFARVFSGNIRPDQKVYVLGPKYDPSSAIDLLHCHQDMSEALKGFDHISIAEVSDVYLMLGQDFKQLDCACAGAVVGLRGLESHIIKSATVASTPSMTAFTDLMGTSTPILRVAIEPQDPRDFPKLRAGLKLLNQADPCVQVALQDSGEYVIVTAGEVHLQRCIDDLQERYAKVPIRSSDPIVSFRETITAAPTVDMLNEVIEGENVNTRKDEDFDPLGVVEVSGGLGTMRCRAVPLPAEVTKLLEKHGELLRCVANAGVTMFSVTAKEEESRSIVHFGENDGDNSSDIRLDVLSGAFESGQELNRETFEALSKLKSDLDTAFRDAGQEWENAVNEIWSFGPQGCGPNILLNRIPSYPRGSVWEKIKSVDSPLAAYDRSLVTGYQMATASGPLCEEPMYGVCFIVEDWNLQQTHNNQDSEAVTFGVSHGQVISLTKDTLRKAFEKQCQRLVCAMYSCSITVTSEVVGKMYSVIDKRHGRIVDGDIRDGSTSWNVTAYLPVIESMNFANELRKSTSGEAMPQLIFSHWEILDIDPFWEPQTTEELVHWGEKSDSGNIARKYINLVRKRKGLRTDEKIVDFAEKQRTLSKNK